MQIHHIFKGNVENLENLIVASYRDGKWPQGYHLVSSRKNIYKGVRLHVLKDWPAIEVDDEPKPLAPPPVGTHQIGTLEIRTFGDSHASLMGWGLSVPGGEAKGEADKFGFPEFALFFDTLIGILSRAAELISQDSDLNKPTKSQKPSPPQKESDTFAWLDWYHAMKKAGYKMTFPLLAKESGFSANHLKQEHMRYKAERGIT